MSAAAAVERVGVGGFWVKFLRKSCQTDLAILTRERSAGRQGETEREEEGTDRNGMGK